jgi:hypothetical protein
VRLVERTKIDCTSGTQRNIKILKTTTKLQVD